jgi:hypothetical protein
MQDLDSFISPIPGFEGDVPILAIPVLVRPPGGDAIDDPSAGSSAGASKTQVSKRKATTNPTPQKKAKKSIGKSSSGIKINEPMPKVSASTPPLGPWKGIPIHQSIRYSYLEYIYIFLSPIILVQVNPYVEYLRISTRPHPQRVFQSTVTPQRWTSPQILKLRRPHRSLRSP